MSGFPHVGDEYSHRYRIVRRLGQGGMGAVYEAQDLALDRPVALKIILPTLPDSEDYRARFAREASTLARIRSRHIINIYEYGEHEDAVYIVTELIPDGDLQMWLARHGPLPRWAAVAFMAQVCEALSDAHAAGVIHRDVKPGNVLVWNRPEGLVPFLCDFGIAIDGQSHLTRSGVLVGSPSYMAPERHLGHPADVRGDVYSAGCLLWAALTGHAPYLGTDFQVMNGHLNDPIPQLATGHPLDDRLDLVLRQAMAKDPAERFQSAAALRAALLSIVGSPSAGAVPAPSPGLEGSGPRPMAAPRGSISGEHHPLDQAAAAAALANAPTSLGTPAGGQVPQPAAPMVAPGPPPAPPTGPSHRRPDGPVGPVGPVGPPAYPSGPAPRRRSRKLPLLVAAVLVLLAGAGVAAWQLWPEQGERPLTANEKSAAAAIAGHLEGDTWLSSSSERTCAAESFVRSVGLSRLQGDGLLTGDRTIDPRLWTAETATAWYDGALGCVPDWPAALAAGAEDESATADCYRSVPQADFAHLLALGLTGGTGDDRAAKTSDTIQACAPATVLNLRKVRDGDRSSVIEFDPPLVGGSRVQEYRITTSDGHETTTHTTKATVRFGSNDGPFSVTVTPVLASASGSTIDGGEVTLDDLDPFGPPGPPSGSAAPAYLGVRFTVTAPSGNGRPVSYLQYNAGDGWQRTHGSRFTVDADEGGARQCARVRAVSEDGGTVLAGRPQRLCGHAAPRTVTVVRNAKCSGTCPKYTILISGFRAFSTPSGTFHYSDGTAISCSSGDCKTTFYVGSDGRAKGGPWTFSGTWGQTLYFEVDGVRDSYYIP